MPLVQSKRVAIIGGGCAGVTTFWALQHSVHDVHLLEDSSSLGGRIKALPFEYGEARVDVNTESPCFNAEASPNFVYLLRYLGISTSPVHLLFGASDGADTNQWQCSVLDNVLLRPWSLCSLETCWILFDIVRLKYLVLDLLMDRPSFNQNQRSSSVHEYLSNEGFSTSFRDKYLTPLLSTLWGTNAGRFLPQFPIKALARFLYDRQLLCFWRSVPSWRRVNVAASQVIQRMTDGSPPSKIHLRMRVQQVIQGGKNKYTLLMRNGEQMSFDHVIFAVDSQEVFRLLQSGLNAEEKEILQDIRMVKNIAVLHSDPLLMPNSQTCPPCNYIISSSNNPDPSPHPPKACLTYDINALQNIPTYLFGPISITINPFTPPHPRLVQAVWKFTTTEPSNTTLDAQRRLPSIQNRDGLSYCSSSVWTGRGFFEDAVTGALRVAVEHLGADVAFDVDFHRRELDDEGEESMVELGLGVGDHLVLTGLGLLRVYVRTFELLLALLGVFWIWVGTWKRRIS